MNIRFYFKVFILFLIQLLKGFHDKCVEKADNTSCICSAFSGEEKMNCTVKRGLGHEWIFFFLILVFDIGSITIYENRLTLVGALQPGPLGEMVNKPDPQGYFDRHIFVPADRDTSVQFLDRLKPIYQIFSKFDS